MKYQKIVLLGGSGFVGTNLALKLSQQGYQVTIPCRRPHRLRELTVNPNIKLVQANIMDQAQLTQACKDKEAVINLVGILNESRKVSFRRVHVDLVKSVVHACQTNKIKRLLHMSALQANQASGSSLYLRTKGEGENLIHTFGQKDLYVTSFQPSVIFGPGDSFVNRFDGILKLCIGMFPLACPNSRFAPVFIGDVVSFIASTINDPDSFSKRYPLCGPETWTLKQIVEQIKQTRGYHCKIIGMPNSLAKLQAVVLQNLPGKLFTMDNYRSLQTDSTCDQDYGYCTSSFSHYLAHLSRPNDPRSLYDDYRKQI